MILSPMQSTFTGVQWPCALTDKAASVAALLAQLDETQRLDGPSLAKAQHRQLAALAEHAAQHSPYFADRLKAAGLHRNDLSVPGALARLPILTREMLQTQESRIFSDAIPSTHLPISETSSSGSLGQPVQIKRTALNQLFWQAFTLREHLWQRRDFLGTLAVIRANLPAEGVSLPNWGEPVSLLYKTGPGYAISSSRPIPEQAAWLEKVQPQYLLTYPTNLSALLDHFEVSGRMISSLLQVRTIGETVSLALRRRVRTIFGVEIADTYSSQELGIMAIQSSERDRYHVMTEGYILEVVDAQGGACLAGEIGRVVVTDLHNYAMPLVRYDTGDFAQVADRSADLYGTRSLARVMGRKRNMILIDGTLRWPTLNTDRYRQVAPVQQYQLVQVSYDTIEVNLVCDPLTTGQEHQIAKLIEEGLEHAFRLVFRYHNAPLPLGRTGKFEEFISLIT